MIRKPVVAGRFYEENPARLKKTVKSYLKTVPPVKGTVCGILVPHAGYSFSGPTAGAAFSYIQEADFDAVIVIGTGHTVEVKGAAIMAKGSFETPLGRVEIDEEIAARLLKSSSLFEDLPAAHQKEHSIEVELPFLQVIKGDALKIVPVIVNTSDLNILTEAGRLIGAALKGKKALICVSSDLSHYPPEGMADKSDRSLLMAFQTSVAARDLARFELAGRLLTAKTADYLSVAACGQAAMIMGAAACLELGADEFKLLEYTNSGRVSGDMSAVVGYAAGLFLKGGNPVLDVTLPEDLKKYLLTQARGGIEFRLKNKKTMVHSLSTHPELNQPAAVFVTLTKAGELRGCIGSMEAVSTLSDAVSRYASASAFEDPRFSPLSADELAEIKIEISVLSPLRKVESHEEIREGKHGVYVQKGRFSGTYLPQVWEHFKTKEDFLNSLCLEKAGLAAGAWKEKSTALFVYTVDAFEEN